MGLVFLLGLSLFRFVILVGFGWAICCCYSIEFGVIVLIYRMTSLWLWVGYVAGEFVVLGFNFV